MLKDAAGTLFLLFFSTSIIFAQSITSKLDSLSSLTRDDLSKLHSLVSIDISDNTNDIEKYQINLANAISYFLIFDNYDEQTYKIQIIEKGIDKLKSAIKLFPYDNDTKNQLKSMYDELFNLYYSYKAGNNISGIEIKNILHGYFSLIKNDEVINWFNNKFWRN
jgi:hypothetical protein